jgi:hypothetical protein
VVLCRNPQRRQIAGSQLLRHRQRKFKAVNSRPELHAGQDREAQATDRGSIQRYLSALDTADRTMPLLEFGPRSAHLKDKLSACASRCVAWMR